MKPKLRIYLTINLYQEQKDFGKNTFACDYKQACFKWNAIAGDYKQPCFK